ncbi:MAG: hypothetical protein LQ344_002931 [Seirophora lacunosa]|nr:MAG: hypothetical protein LQ344_002931 [Seirophora lacunosa]
MLQPSCRLLRATTCRIPRRPASFPYFARRLLVVPAADARTPLQKSNDDALRNIFDSQPFWRNFRDAHRSTTLSPQGLFQNHYLTKPDGFIDFARTTAEKCQRLVARVVGASSVEEQRLIPKVLDRLSDSLCRVLDIADFVRATHPDAAFRDAATDAYNMLYEFMNVLNTTPDLKIRLETALNDPTVSARWTDEEKMVAQMLLKDFAKSAIEASDEKRHAFVELSNRVRQLGTEFMQGIRPESSTISLSNRQLKGVDPCVLQSTSKRHFTGSSIPTYGAVAFIALQSMEDESARRDLYIAMNTSSKAQVQTLQDFLKTRARVANLAGFASFAEMNLTDKLAKTPVAVNSFLDALSRDNKSHVQQEVDEMLNLKKLDTGGEVSGVQIEPWDTDYYKARLAEKHRSRSRRPDFMSAYFSLGTVMQGLSRLFTHLYGVHFVPTAIAPGEAWDPDVRRLDVIDETEGRIAVLYCDLFARPEKNPNPTHFTLRCSRRIDPSEIEEASSLHPNLDPLQTANDGMAVSHNPATNTTYQLPTIALICDFEPPSSSSSSTSAAPTLLPFRDVQTLFHEMGHAIHSILGRTAHQVVSGTRCATDFSEMPSILMEFFLGDPGVLALFARHWRTGAALPFDMVAERLALDRRAQGLETERQILLAALDQAYHSALPLTTTTSEEEEEEAGSGSGSGFGSTRVLHEVHARYGSVGEPRGTSPQGFFGHLVEYGGTYYSYLFDRAIAGKVWEEVFDAGRGAGAVSREKGERFRGEVLKWGGSRDGWTCLASVLRDETLKDGGPEAMAAVGRWGVRD